jgi:hypothetical protein
MAAFARMARLAALLGALSGCSFILDTNANQCMQDSDCWHFDATYPKCVQGVCVPSGLGPPGCFYGAPSTATQFENQCTTAQCIPFDNCARLGLCDGGTLPALVHP